MWSIEETLCVFEELTEGEGDVFSIDDVIQIWEGTRDSNSGKHDATMAICHALQIGYIVGYRRAKRHA